MVAFLDGGKALLFVSHIIYSLINLKCVYAKFRGDPTLMQSMKSLSHFTTQLWVKNWHKIKFTCHEVRYRSLKIIFNKPSGMFIRIILDWDAQFKSVNLRHAQSNNYLAYTGNGIAFQLFLSFVDFQFVWSSDWRDCFIMENARIFNNIPII